MHFVVLQFKAAFNWYNHVTFTRLYKMCPYSKVSAVEVGRARICYMPSA